MATWAIGKTFHVIRGRVVCIIVLSFQNLDPDLLVLIDDLCQNIKIFSLNSIGCVTKVGPAGILEEIQPTDVCKANVLKSSYRRFEVIFNR